MASLCNYSHPDPRLAQGLVHQGAGRLFPYNPEFYDNASGLYGPGAIYCWYMLLASVLASWSFYLVDHGSLEEPGLSSDLIGALAYPVFAATDLLVQSIRLQGMDYRALAILCLRFPKHELDDYGPFDTVEIDLHHIPPDILDFGQRVVNITGPLTILIRWNELSIIPDLGIRVSERDQLATLIVGVFTLSLTLFDIGRHLYRKINEREVAEEGIEMLPTS
ncbi:hypothetical protein ACHAPA_005202 [Fusarium lateritium]